MEDKCSKMKSNYKALTGMLFGAGISCFLIAKQQECINRWKSEAEKNRALFLLMDQWANIKQEGKNLEAYFERYHYKRIAVYGMSYAGMRLCKELKHSGIKIAYGIDRNAGNIYSDIKLITPNDKLEDVDAIVITAIAGFDDICDELSKKITCPFLSIEDILNEI